MTPAIVKGLIEKRPFLSVLELNAFLLGQKLTPEQAAEFYRKAFVHINLNTGTREEFVLIPGAGTRMAKEFAEYRPWKNWAQFDKEIGKYVGQQETDRFKQYMFIPDQPEHRQRRGPPDHPGRRSADGAGVQGIPALEDEGAVRQGDRQVRRAEGDGPVLAVCRDSVGRNR